MNFKIEFPEVINCDIDLPASKSISNRALIINALSGNKDSIANIARCDDTDVMVKALSNTHREINIGAAGTSMRFLTSYFAIQNNRTVILDGSERMRKRPIRILVDALRSCGADIQYLGEEGFPPLEINGKTLTSPGSIEIPGNISSQYISSIMMIAPYITGGLTIKLTGDMLSIPYIDMTIALMKAYGINVSRIESVINISEGKYSPIPFAVESDWSASSYWYEIVSLLPGSEITFSHLSENSLQGDSMVSNYFSKIGVNTTCTADKMKITTSSSLFNNQLILDLTNQPDLAQTIVVTACLLNCKFIIKGLSTLKIKETDRIEALRNELRKLGYLIQVDDDFSLSWGGKTTAPTANPQIETYDDHRMAMAFAPAAIFFPGLVIKDIEVVSKSYPDFWIQLKQAGVKLSHA